MVDRIKFYLICCIHEGILTEKMKYSYEKDGKEYFVFDFNKISFLSKISFPTESKRSYHSFEFSDLPSDEDTKHSYRNLIISFARTKGEKIGRFTVQQNLRKNFIGHKNYSPFYDLKYRDFVEIINLYADEFQIPRYEFWEANVTQLELGVNLWFNVNVNTIISSFSQLKRVPIILW